MRQIAGIVLACFGSAIVALVVAVVLAGISQSGVINMQITHVLFWIAFVISVTAVTLGVLLLSQSLKYSLLALVGTVVLVGGGLWWLDSWLTLKKAEQDVANQPPNPIYKTPSGPSVPIIKTPLSRPPRPAKPQQDNSVHIGNGSKLELQSSGDCSPNIVGGANTVTCGPPAPKITWTPTEYIQPAGAARPVVWAKMYLDKPFNNPQFAVSCDRPCIGTNMGGLPMGAIQPYYKNTAKNVVIFAMDPPNPLPGDRFYFWGVQSKDDLPVHITNVQIVLPSKH